MSTIDTWMPLAASLLLVALAIWLVLGARQLVQQDRRPRVDGNVSRGIGDFDDLDIALDSAMAVNAFSRETRSDPLVRLQDAVRLAPHDYRSTVSTLSNHIRSGRVVSLDLSGLEQRDAARLEDFSSGLMSASSGWIFRVSGAVLILTPGRHKRTST